MRYRSSIVAASMWVSLALLLGLGGAVGVQAWRRRTETQREGDGRHI
jgi:hypothetical protein